MLKQIEAGVKFITSILLKDEEDRIKFGVALAQSLKEKYQGHWYPKNPEKGRAYRIIIIENYKREKLLQDAASKSGVELKKLSLPIHMAVWIDPDEVAYKFGDDGSICAFACFNVTPVQHENPVTGLTVGYYNPVPVVPYGAIHMFQNEYVCL